MNLKSTEKRTSKTTTYINIYKITVRIDDNIRALFVYMLRANASAWLSIRTEEEEENNTMRERSIS